MKVRFLLAAALLCFMAGTYGLAQTANATLGGTVSDASGALLPGVTVTATNTQTGVVISVVSNEAGAYQFASLQPGTYTVAAELPGFQARRYDGMSLGLSQQVRLNITLQVGNIATAVDVTAAVDTLLATTSSSVGTVLPDYKIRDLPLPNRDIFGLIATTAGTQAAGRVEGIFAGARATMVNTTRDGMNVSDGRYDNGAFAVTYTSPDLVEEVRVIVSPADAELGRGSGQVQMATRSGTNQFHGSLFWNNRNSALDASNWFNNFRGEGKNYENRNQFGGRLGGPIIANKTFFFFLFEGQRIVQRQSALGTVLTAEARQGNFRFFPGVQNGNIFSSTPTVDVNGNPVRPAAATGSLQSFNVFTRDPLRTGFDTSGWVQSVIAKMPLPNDFTVGDGLNTAGIRWTRRVIGTDFATADNMDVNRNQYNFRIDHNFNPSHKLFVTGTKENTWYSNFLQAWPTGGLGYSIRDPYIYGASFVSTLSPTVVNEFRAGWKRSGDWEWSPMTKGVANFEGGIGEEGAEWLPFFPINNGIPMNPIPSTFTDNLLATSGGATTRGTRSPSTQFSDTVSWTRGEHAFRGGFEYRMANSEGGFNQDLWPRVNFGAGGVAVTGIDGMSITGLHANDQTTARNLLTDLNASVGSVRQAFLINSSQNVQFLGWPELKFRSRDYHQNGWAAFFKDDWKAHTNLTLNLGVRYDYYGVGYEDNGILGRPVGGAAGLFGISGTDFSALWQPGRTGGSLTRVELVGKNSPNSDTPIHNNDWNNFAPSVGMSWSLPWWGRDKTVLRAGYGLNYTGHARFFGSFNSPQGSLPGMNSYPQPEYSSYTNLAAVRLPISGPGIPGVPLEPAPLTDRVQNMQGFDDNRTTPYIQNWSLELQREIARNLTAEVRYVGSKGTRLWGGIPLNSVNIFENGILDAFNITRAGGNAELFNRMLNGINLGSGPVNGTTVTGSASLRQSTIFRGLIANGDVGQFAQSLNQQTAGTGEAGGLLRRNGFPENFIVVNPQFNNVTMDGNPGNSTYHSLNLAVTKRLSLGFTNQTTYSWSRAIGENDGDGTLNYLNPRNRSLNKTLLGYHRTHDFKSNGTFMFPFGPGRRLLGNASGPLARLVEQWQLGAIFGMSSGPPLTVTATTSSIYQATGNTPIITGDVAKSLGKVTRVANGVVYFDGLRQVDDPARSAVTTSNATQGSFSNRAIADAQGNILLMNPAPGQLGTLGQRWIEGPGVITLDANLVKRVQIDESKQFEFRIDAINVLNRPNFGNPVLDINSNTFGRITTATGNRSFVVNARVNF
jgi:hypothetical protein